MRELPSGWMSSAVEDCFDVTLGKMLSKEASEGVIQHSYLANKNVQWNRIDLRDLKTMHFTSSERQRYVLLPEDLLVTEGGEIGRTSIWHGEVDDCYFQNALHRLRPVRGIEPRYMLHYMQFAAHAGLFAHLAGQTSIAHLPKEKFARWRVIHPGSLVEQRRIVKILDATDTQIDSTRAWIAKAARLRISTMLDLLRPGKWPVRRVGELLAESHPAMRSGPFGSSLLKEQLVEAGIPLLGIDNVQTERFSDVFVRFVGDGTFNELRRYQVRPGDLMITIMGTVGRCCVVPDSIGPALSSKHTWTISFDPALYRSALACIQINHAPWALNHLARDTQGGTMGAIRSDTLRTLPLPVPPMEEQIRIENALAGWRAAIDAESRRTMELTKLKQAAADDLLTGRVRVPVGAGV